MTSGPVLFIQMVIPLKHINLQTYYGLIHPRFKYDITIWDLGGCSRYYLLKIHSIQITGHFKITDSFRNIFSSLNNFNSSFIMCFINIIFQDLDVIILLTNTGKTFLKM